jgi:RecB family exonuclease
MLKLICGAATAPFRRLLVDSFVQSGGRDGTLIIVPDDHCAHALATAWSRRTDVLQSASIISLHDLNSRVVAGQQGCTVDAAERLVILRELLQGDVGSYDWLVGDHSVPHLTYGVLRRISDAMMRVEAQDEAAAQQEEPQVQRADHPRLRQLRKLSDAYAKKLAAAGALDARTVLRQGWSALTRAQLDALLPPYELIVFDQFSSVDEQLVLVLRRLRDLAPDVLLLLPYSPEADTDRYAHLNAMYDRLYDMSDSVILEPPNVDDVPPQNTATLEVIDAPSRNAEVETIARFLRSEMQMRAPGSFPYHEYVVAFPQLHTYAPLVENLFSDFGIPAVVELGEPLLKHPLARLLQLLRDAVTTGGSLPALRAFFRSPFSAKLLTLQGWAGNNLLSQQLETLDRIRRQEAISSGGEQLLDAVQEAVAKLEKRLARQEEIDSGAEEAYETSGTLRQEIDSYRRLAATLQAATRLFHDLEHSRTLELWQATLAELMIAAMADAGHLDDACETGEQLDFRSRTMLAKAHEEILAALGKLQTCSTLLGQGPQSFAAVLSALRILLRDVRLYQDLELEPGVRVVPLSRVAAHYPQVLLLGGLVDTELPQYASREARLDDFEARVLQKHNISQQRALFDSAIRSAQSKALLFVPRTDGESELLESQFVEELIDEGSPAVKRLPFSDFLRSAPGDAISARGLLGTMAKHIRNEDCSHAAQLKKLNWSGGEQRIVENVIHSLCAEAERQSRSSLGNFDGFIYEPELVQYLRHRVEQHVHSVSQLDALVQCPFRYFVQYILQVDEPEEKEERTAPREAGILAHSILHAFYTEWIKLGRGAISAGNRDDAAKLMALHAQRELQKAGLSGFEHDCLSFRLFGSEGVDGLMGKVRKDPAPGSSVRDYPGMLRALIDLEVDRSESSQGAGFEPTYFELGFGLKPRRDGSQDALSSTEPAVMELPSGECVQLRGRADRLDVGAGHFAIVDYKTGGSPNITEQRQGFKVQLPVYLLALQQLLAKRGQQLEPAGGMFMKITPTEAEVTGQFFRKSFLRAAGIPTKRGMTDDDFEESLELVRYRIGDGLARIREGRFHVTLAGEKIACAYCNSAAVCRKDLPRAEKLVPIICG